MSRRSFHKKLGAIVLSSAILVNGTSQQAMATSLEERVAIQKLQQVDAKAEFAAYGKMMDAD